MGSFNKKNVLITGCTDDVGQKVVKRFVDYMLDLVGKDKELEEFEQKVADYPKVVLFVKSDFVLTDL